MWLKGQGSAAATVEISDGLFTLVKTLSKPKLQLKVLTLSLNSFRQAYFVRCDSNLILKPSVLVWYIDFHLEINWKCLRIILLNKKSLWQFFLCNILVGFFLGYYKMKIGYKRLILATSEAKSLWREVEALRSRAVHLNWPVKS